MRSDILRIYIIDERDQAETFRDKLAAAFPHGTPISIKAESLKDGYADLVHNGNVADGVFIHGSASEDGLSGLGLARELSKIGYTVTLYTMAGAKEIELRQYQHESGVASAMTWSAIDAMITFLKMLN